jgi:hypothetical protein
MGDNHRFEIVSSYIIRNFKPCKVADIAGGQGELSKCLTQAGFDCTVIDPCHPHPQKNVRRIKGCFVENMAVDYDLLIGLHPDEATEPICKAAKLYRKPAVIVPCCNHFSGEWKMRSGDTPTVVKMYLESIHVQFRYAYLKMKGMNVAFLINKG